MAVQVQTRRGTTAEHSSFTGANGEVTVDTDKEVVVVHDGATAGGYPQMRENGSNSALALGSAGTPSLKFTGDTNTGIYSPGADQVSVATGGTERLRIDSTGQIESVSLGTAAAPTYSFTTDPNTGIYSPGADQVAISTGGSGRLFVDASGNVGINTASTIAPGGFGYAREFALTGATSGDSSAAINIRGSRTVSGGFGDINFWHQSTSNRAYIQARRGSSDSAIDLDFITSGGAGMRITSAGLVGVGTSAPSNTLHVAGTGSTQALFERTGSNGVFIGLKDSSGSLAYLGSTNGVFSIQTPGSSYSDKLVVTSAGLVGVGTTSPGATLDVRGNGTFTGNATARQTVDFTNTGGQLYVGVESSAGGAVFTGSSAYAGIVGTNNSTNLQLATNGAVRATLDTSGRLGIGTSSPAAKLHLGDGNIYLERTQNGSAASPLEEAIITYGVSSTARGGLYAINQYVNSFGTALAFKVTSTAGVTSSALTIGTSGAVGIGTIAPDVLLTTRVASGPIARFRTADTNFFGIDIGTDGASQAFIESVKGGSGSYQPLAFWTGGSQRATIDTSGRLLVGTSSTSHGSAGAIVNRSSGTSSPSSTFKNGLWSVYSIGGEPAYVLSSNINTSGVAGSSETARGGIGFEYLNGSEPTRFVIGTVTASSVPSPVTFWSEGTERMRIAQNGVTALFSSASSTFIPRSSAAADTSNFLIQGTYGATNTTNGTVSFQVFTNGNVQNTNNSYGAISDIKLKENIVDATPQWDDIKALQVRKYNFKEGQTHTQIGLIAQEVELISPGLVTESPDRDEDGNDLGTTTKSVNYSVLYMKAVKALQEAMERIEVLEQRLADAGIA